MKEVWEEEEGEEFRMKEMTFLRSVNATIGIGSKVSASLLAPKSPTILHWKLLLELQ